MLNIAICDDDIQIAGQMEMMIQNIAKRNYVDTDIEVFWNGKSLADTVASGDSFDIIFLDIEMDKEDGISAAKRIRMNNIFMLGFSVNNNQARINSAITVIILLGMNVLIFYIYMKLADDLRLRRMTAVYEQQLDLCERHQQERELSTLQLRDVRHNMKNNLVSILAYVVIMYFDRAKMKKSTFEFIVKVKGELGQLVPILAVIEEGSAQDIFSVLEAGIFDYIEVTDNLQKYAKKIEELFLWGWYLRKYEFLEKRGCREIDNLKQEQ